MQIVSQGANLHEMSRPVFWKNKKQNQIIVCLFCQESCKG